MWFATNVGLAKLSPTDPLELILPPDNASGGSGYSAKIIDTLIDGHGNMWVLSTNQLYQFDRINSLFTLYPLSSNNGQELRMQALYHHQGKLFIATLDGLMIINPSTTRTSIIRHNHDSDKSNNISNNRILDVLFSTNDHIWLATHNGINQLIPAGDDYQIIQHHNAEEQFQSTVYALLEDDGHNIWLSQNSGISRFDPSNNEWLSFNVHEGLLPLEFNGGAKLKDPNGEFWFGGAQGINAFIPATVPAHRKVSELALRSYTVNNKLYNNLSLDNVKHINIDYHDKVISLEVIALDFSYPNINKFAFFLDGFDDQWREKEHGNIVYTNLNPGQYTLRVRHGLMNNKVSDTDLLTLNVQVNAPFYMTQSAYLSYVVLGILLLLLLYLRMRYKHRIRQENASATKASEERLQLALWASGDGMWDWNIPNNEVFRTKLFHHYEELESRSIFSAMHAEDKPRVKFLLDQHLQGKTQFFEAEYRVKQADNQWVWLLDRGKVVEFDIQGQPLRMAGSHKDITRRKAIESDLRLSSQVLKSMNEAVVIADLEYQIQSVNPAFNKVTGFDDTFILNRHFISLAADKSQTTLFHQIRETIVQEHHWHGEVSIHTASDSVLLVLLQINQISDENGIPTHYVAVFTDITARKQAEHALQQMANYDTLTGLPNRTLFQDRLQQALIKARRNRTKVALFFLDLDRFKHINDSLGHHIGDLLLQAVAQRLQNIVRETDTVTRLGGDEFTIIMEDIKCDKDAKTIAEKILTSFNDAFVLADNTLTITTSIGISMAPLDADENSLLVQFADTAMYHAKARGRNNYQFYTTQLNAYAKRHVELEAALKQAIFYNELSLVYQPKFNIIDGTLSGVEALLRWHSATLGSISPSEFIPLAEETGFIKNIGLWVINSACAQIAHWQLQGLDPINVAINLSSRQLNEHIVEHIEQAISAFEIPAKMLELELTESAIMDNPEESVTILTQLKSLGLSIAVDDFGTGYSSLSYLKRFPIDTLKIDQEFVRDITQDPEDAAITNTIITLAHSLDLNVVAEGVETQSQYDFLASHNCDQVQGYLLSKPLTVTDCEYLLGQRQSQDIAG